jgi:hypothetical protein
VSRYQARILALDALGSVTAETECALSEEDFALAKLEALRASDQVPGATVILLMEGPTQIATCRLEDVVAEWSQGSVSV